MKGEGGQPIEDPLGASIPFFGLAGDPASFDRYEGKLAGDEEGIDQKEERDERQTGDGTNWVSPSGSRSERG